MPICTENVCIGSVMIPNQHVRKPDEVRSKEELLPLATDFIDQYYTSIKRQVQPCTIWLFKHSWTDNDDMTLFLLVMVELYSPLLLTVHSEAFFGAMHPGCHSPALVFRSCVPGMARRPMWTGWRRSPRKSTLQEHTSWRTLSWFMEPSTPGGMLPVVSGGSSGPNYRYTVCLWKAFLRLAALMLRTVFMLLLTNERVIWLFIKIIVTVMMINIIL